MLASLLVLVASQQPLPPPPSALRYRVAFIECTTPGGSGLHPAPVRDLFTSGLLGSNAVELVGGSTAPQASAPLVTDPEGIARAGQGTGAHKVFCAAVDPLGAMPVLHAQLVDVATARPEWSRVAPTDGSEPGVRDVVTRQAQELSSFLAQMQQARPAQAAAPTPPPAVPVVTTVATAAEEQGPMKYLTWKRGAGAALVAVGALLIPTSLLAFVMAGVGHMSPGADGPPAFVLYNPNQPKPRYYAPVFTLTWADVVTTGILTSGAIVLIAAGVVLLLWPA